MRKKFALKKGEAEVPVQQFNETQKAPQLNNTEKKQVRRALVSVFDKTNLSVLAEVLKKYSVEVVSTGSTASVLVSFGVNVVAVDSLTGFPECLDGRVKTLHPKVHAGILADLRLSSHVGQLEDLEIKPFDLVVVNLYPFSDTVASGADFQECIEKIDIGGPTMVRAAAKNFANVAVVTDPSTYSLIGAKIEQGGLTELERFELSKAAFEHTAAYDVAVASWFSEKGLGFQTDLNQGESPNFGDFEGATYKLVKELRYGENSHQAAAIMQDVSGQSTVPFYGSIVSAKLLSSGKEMSFNNYVDSEAALRAAYDHQRPCVAIVKHANPCGIAVGDDISQAYTKAFACDPVSAYGGVIAANREVTAEMALQIKPVFIESITAPGYTDEALEILSSKKSLRILQNVPVQAEQEQQTGHLTSKRLIEAKKITGGLLVQERDQVNADGDNSANWQLVSGAPADAELLAELEFAWKTIRAVKSNAILLSKDGATVGIGMGQVNRLDSCNLAVLRANTLGTASQGAQDASSTIDTAGGAQNSSDTNGAPERARGSIAASDAFFPFSDGLQILIDAGVKAVVQPGGSIRDDEVIEAAKAAGITMYLTGVRHFNH